MEYVPCVGRAVNKDADLLLLPSGKYSYSKYGNYGTYKRSPEAEAEAEAEADADIDALLDVAFAIKNKRATYNTYGKYGK